MDRNLNYYIQNGDLKSIKEMVESGFDIKTDLQAALSEAAHKSQIDLVKYFVSIGAVIDANENHALRIATMMKSPYYGNLEVIDYLVKNGADVDAIKDTRHPVIKEWLENYLAVN